MYKSKLQEICQRRQWELPEYQIKKEGPDHSPRYQATLVIDGDTFQSRNTCRSSKQAQNEVAHIALRRLVSPYIVSPNWNAPTNNPNNDHTHLKERTKDGQVPEIGVSAPVVEEDRQTKGELHAVNELTNCITSQQRIEEIREVGEIPEFNLSTSIVEQDKGTKVTRELTNNISTRLILQEQRRGLDRVLEPSGLTLAPNSSNKMKDMNHLCKSQLQTYTQKQNLNLPTYIPEREGPAHACRFRCKVVVGEQTFGSQEFFPTLKEAENTAAKIALASLGSNANQEGDCLVYKNMLQELAQKKSFLLPVYETTRSGASHSPTFISTVEVDGKVFGGHEAKTKKLAEMSAAKVAYMSLTGATPSQTPSFPQPSELQEKPDEASPAKSSASSGLQECPQIRSRKVVPDVPSKWVEVHEEEPLFPDLVRGPANVSFPAEKKMDISPMLENPTKNDTAAPSVDEIANELITGTGNCRFNSGERVVVRPWTHGMTLPPGAELVFRDNEWVAFRLPKP